MNLTFLNPFKKRGEKFSHMRLSTILFIGYRNMFSNRMRSLLTIGGVAIGIGIITLLISLGFGVQGMVIREVTRNNPIDIIDISNKSLENFSLIDKTALDRIKKIEGVMQVEIRTSIGGKIFNGDSQTDAVINAVSRQYLDLARSDLSKDTKELLFVNPRALLVTPKLAELVGFSNPNDAIGKEIAYTGVVTDDMLGDVDEISTTDDDKAHEGRLTIVGVVPDQTNNDAVYAFVSIDEIRKRYGKVAGQFAKVRVRDNSFIEPVRLDIEQTAFVTESVVDTVADINSFFSIVRAILVIFGVIIMSISAMGMLNTLSISLLQRTKEVGILKALGTKRADIFKIFIIEAFLISFLGGFAGLVFGYSAAKGINFIINILAAKYDVSPTAFVEMPSVFSISIILFIFFLGLITGVFPAARAARIHALEALRYE